MMRWRYLRSITSFLFLVMLLDACVQSDYTKLVKSELAKGIRQDSILLGIRFGDTRNEFFGKCFDLNKQHLVSQGPRGIAVQYLYTDSLVHEQPIQIKLLFSPSFDQNDTLSDMDLEFSYQAWAPWNRELQSDSMKIKVMRLLMLWYKGNEFISIKMDTAKIPIKLDGNRRLMIYTVDTQSVIVRVQDILHPKFRHSISSERKKED